MYHVSKQNRAIYIHGEIGREADGDIGAATIVKGLETLGKGPVKVFINSQGGNLIESFAMLEELRRHSGQITISCDGLVASAATVFLTERSWIREATATAEVMIHRCSSGMIGNCFDMREMADLLEKYDRKMAGLYAAITDLSVDAALAAMTEEKYFDSSEAASVGFIDRIIGSSVDAAQYPRLAKASATAKKLAIAKSVTPAVAASASSKSGSWSKVDRIQRALGIARKSAERKAYEKKIEIALEAIRYGQDPQEALRRAR